MFHRKINNFISYKNELYFNLVEKNLLTLIRFLKAKNYSKKKSEPFVSIYTPTRNRSKILIERAIKGVLNQTYKNFEYIIVGDYCDDDTKKEVNKINDERIIFFDLRDYNIKKKKLTDTKELWLRGAAYPSNFAYKKAKGSWIARCDDDEMWSETFLEKSLKFAIENNLELVSCKSIYLGEKKSSNSNYTTLHPNYNKNLERIYSDYFQTYNLKNKNNPFIGAPSTWLMKSYLKLFKWNVDCWRKDWNAVNDSDLIEKFAISGVRIGHLNKRLVYQMPRPGNSFTGWLGAQEDYDKNIKNLKD